MKFIILIALGAVSDIAAEERYENHQNNRFQSMHIHFPHHDHQHSLPHEEANVNTFYGDTHDPYRKRCCPSQTTITTRPLIAARSRTVPVNGLNVNQECMMQCSRSLSDIYYKPVCGTNRITYLNIEQLNCAKACGQDIQVLCETSCPMCDVARGTIITTRMTESLAQTTKSDDVNLCMQSCPTTKDHNPVCGSNDMTYSNPSYLLCAQACGEDVRVKRFTACDATSTQPGTTGTMTPTESNKDDLLSALAGCSTVCRVTTEYNRICRTSGVTYDNTEGLQCTKHYGANTDLGATKPCYLVIPTPASGTPDVISSQPPGGQIPVTSTYQSPPARRTPTTTSTPSQLQTTSTTKKPNKYFIIFPDN